MNSPVLSARPRGRIHLPSRAVRRLGFGLALTAVIGFAPAAVMLTLAIASGLVLGVAALALIASRVVRRAASNALEQYPHLRRLSHRFERRFADVRVTAVAEAASGQLTIQLAWQDQHTIELDDGGVPDGSSSDGPGMLSWSVPIRPDASLERALVLDLPAHRVTLVEQGLILPRGHVVTSRELIADNGLVLQANPLVSA
jgi:hypothetical protein